MILLDTNILIYAHDENSAHHIAIAQWIENVLLKEDVIGLPWVSVWGFLRVSTNSRIWPNPKSSAQAFSILGDWFSQPGVVLINPGPRHAGASRTPYEPAPGFWATGERCCSSRTGYRKRRNARVNRPGFQPLLRFALGKSAYRVLTYFATNRIRALPR